MYKGGSKRVKLWETHETGNFVRLTIRIVQQNTLSNMRKVRHQCCFWQACSAAGGQDRSLGTFCRIFIIKPEPITFAMLEEDIPRLKASGDRLVADIEHENIAQGKTAFSSRRENALQ